MKRCPHCHDPIIEDDDYEGMHYGCFLVRERNRDEGDREMEVERAEAEREYRDSTH